MARITLQGTIRTAGTLAATTIIAVASSGVLEGQPWWESIGAHGDSWFHQPPTWLLAALAVVMVSVLAALVDRRHRRRVVKDDKRLFTGRDRELIFTYAGGRCEHRPVIGMRCRTKATHADHIWPHAHGGQTIRANGQALCMRHNLAKGAQIPSRAYIRRLERRRGRYFPKGVSGKVSRTESKTTVSVH